APRRAGRTPPARTPSGRGRTAPRRSASRPARWRRAAVGSGRAARPSGRSRVGSRVASGGPGRDHGPVAERIAAGRGLQPEEDAMTKATIGLLAAVAVGAVAAWAVRPAGAADA